MEAMAVLGKTVRQARETKSLSRTQMAELVGVCSRTIANIENDKANPSFDVVKRLVRKLDLSMEDLFYSELDSGYRLKNEVLREISQCPEDEWKVILCIIKGLREKRENMESKVIR